MKNGKCLEDESTTIGNYSSMPSLLYRIQNDIVFSPDNVYIIKSYFIV